MLIAADDALKSAAENGEWTSNEVDRKFGEAIHLLCAFEKDFSLEDPTTDPNICEKCGKVTAEAKISDGFGSPSAILRVLKENLHATVTFQLLIYLSTLTNHSQWATNGRDQQGWSNFIS